MQEPIQLFRLSVVFLAAVAVGCGGQPAPPPGSFKRAPDPEPQVNAQTAAANPATQTASANGIPAGATGSAPGSSGSAAVVAPKFPKSTSISVEPVDASWPHEKKLEQTIARLKKISIALGEYAVKEG